MPSLKEMREDARKAKIDYEKALEAAVFRLRPNQGILVCKFCDNVTIITQTNRSLLTGRDWFCPCKPDVKQDLIYGTRFNENNTTGGTGIQPSVPSGPTGGKDGKESVAKKA